MRWLLLLVVLIVGCNRSSSPLSKAAPTTAPPSAYSPSLLVDLAIESEASAADPRFVLRSEEPSTSNALLWDARVGVNVGPYGTGYDVSGSELPSFTATSMYAKEDLRPSSTVLGLRIFANGSEVKPLAKGYWQTYDLRYGLLTTHWLAPVGGQALEARMTSVILAGEVESRWQFHAPKGTKLKVERSTRLDSSWEPEPSGLIPRLVQDNESEKAWDSAVKSLSDEVSMSSGEATWLDCQHSAGDSRTNMWYRRVPGSLRARLVQQAAKLQIGKAPRIEIDGPVEDQTAIDSFLSYVSQAHLDDGRSAFLAAPEFSPFGLSSSRYNGHVFWDADVWIMPALAFVDPSILQDLANYRASHIQRRGPAPFPWESSASGEETAPGDSRKEIHISGSVLWGLEFEKALGAKIPDDIAKRVADFYLARGSKRPDGKLAILDVMSPDESHIGPNDLYTNLVAQWAINGATWRPTSKSPATMYLPADGRSFITYDNDGFRAYKQAAAVLSIYPLQYPPAEAEAKTMMERFGDKITPNGPAMSNSIHATIWARLGDADRAYTLWKKSWGEYVKGPFLLFSEKRSTPTTYFTTGAAGCLQSVIYGFLGFRVDEQPEPGADWKLHLKNGRWLSIKPHLPTAWKSATFRSFRVLGHAYTLTVKREGSKTVTSVKQGV